MGASFINLQVNTLLESIPETLIPKGYIKLQTAKQWASVYEEKGNFEWNKLSRLGKKISRECAVFLKRKRKMDRGAGVIEGRGGSVPVSAEKGNAAHGKH